MSVLSALTLAACASDESGSLANRVGDGSHKLEPGSFVSDDFDTCALDSVWTFVDPVGDVSLSLVGAGTGAAHAALVLPAGVAHDVWFDHNTTPRLMQSILDSDLELRAKFLSLPVIAYQEQGIIVQEDADHSIIFDFWSDGSNLHVYSAIFDASSATVPIDVEIAGGAPLYLHVDRTGDVWTMEYSYDGSNWLLAGSFTQPIQVKEAGVFAANGGRPAFTSEIDYAFNNFAPIAPEDNAGRSESTLTVDSLGPGTVTAEPAKATYACNEDVTLTAVPDPGSVFGGWNGDLVSSENPLTLTVEEDTTVTATFAEPSAPPVISNINVEVGSREAVISWTTNVPTTSRLFYGETAAYELGFVDESQLLTDHQITLSGLASSTTHHFQIASTSAELISSTSPDQVFLTESAADLSGFISDDFNSCGLGPVWKFTDPVGDVVLKTLGTGTGEATLAFEIPGTVQHNVWADQNSAPRITQSVTDADFELEAKYLSLPTTAYHEQGLLIQQDANHSIIFSNWSDGSNLHIYAAIFEGGNATVPIDAVIPGASPLHLRVGRSGDLWTLTHSEDGQEWATAGSFTHSLTVTDVGAYAANGAPGSPSFFSSELDYLFSTATPVVPEDATSAGLALEVSTAGGGTVNTVPDQPSYACAEDVTLTALPQTGWVFDGWTGDVTSAANPLLVQMNQPLTVVANFVESTSGPTISNVAIQPSTDEATISWVTDVPATSRVDFGITDSYELGFVEQSSLVASHSVTLTGLSPDTSYHYRITSEDQEQRSSSTSDATFRTASGTGGAFSFASDDFNSFNLDSTKWSFVDPLGDVALSVVGTNSGQARLEMSIPGGVVHEIWANKNTVPRLMQDVEDVDFEVEAAFLSIPDEAYHEQGILVEEDEDHSMVFDVWSDGSVLYAFAAIFEGGGVETPVVLPIPAGPTVYLRTKREGDLWTLSYSTNGVGWSVAGTFSHAIYAARVGVFAANGTPDSAQPFTAAIDYVFNTAEPLFPEDPTNAVDTTGPFLYHVAATAGANSITVVLDTDEAAVVEVDYGLTADLELGTVSANSSGLNHVGLITGLSPTTTYFVRPRAIDASGNLTLGTLIGLRTTTPGAGVGIDVFYGPLQRFGHIGRPQAQVNVLGSATSPLGVSSVAYSLNGGPFSSVSTGPDGLRLQDDGDFNIELFYEDLSQGSHDIVIRAQDLGGNFAIETVTIDVQTGPVWPLPYSVDWSTASRIDDVAQVVDGLWELGPSGARSRAAGYDRIVALGDVSWTDYEVTVPIVIHSFDPFDAMQPRDEAGINLVMRWPGHSDWDGSQPTNGWWPYGAYAGYTPDADGCARKIELFGNRGRIRDEQCMAIPLETPFVFKMRVETLPGGGGSWYRFKAWQEGSPEPDWQLSTTEALSNNPQQGALLLLTHFVDASFGDVSVEPIP